MVNNINYKMDTTDFKYEYYKVNYYLSVNGGEFTEWESGYMIAESSIDKHREISLRGWDEISNHQFAGLFVCKSFFKHKGKNRVFMPFYEYGIKVKEWKTSYISIKIKIEYKKEIGSIDDILKLKNEFAIPYLVERGLKVYD